MLHTDILQQPRDIFYLIIEAEVNTVEKVTDERTKVNICGIIFKHDFKLMSGAIIFSVLPLHY